MKIQTISVPIPTPAAQLLPATATSIKTPPIKAFLEDTIRVQANHILMDVDCDETEKNDDATPTTPATPLLEVCDWFLVKNGQTRPPSGLINKSITVNGVIWHLASPCKN